MSRMHYVPIAKIIHDAYQQALAVEDTSCRVTCTMLIREMAYDFAEWFRADNTRFDRDRFLAACFGEDNG